MAAMNTPSSCPFHREQASDPASRKPQGSWPPGPPAGLTGWRLLRRMFRDLPGALADWKARYGDLVHLRIWPEHEVVVTDPQLVRELLLNHHDDLVRWERGMEVFAQAQGQSVFTSEGEVWQRKRQALQPCFTGKAVTDFVAAIAESAVQSLARWPVQADDWPVESALTTLAMDVILRMTFSARIDLDAKAIEEAVRRAMVIANEELYWPASWPAWVPWKRAKRQALATLNTLVWQHLNARLSQPEHDWPDDVLSRLLKLHRQSPQAWPLQAVRDECITAFIAGHETVAASLSWWAWCMASHPEAQAKAADEVRQVLQGRAPSAADMTELPYLTQTLEETLRLYPAAPLLNTRRASRPVNLGPWRFPARTLFLIPVQLMHHDPRWFPDPLAFCPERFARDQAAFPRGAYLPFGAGPRVCLGQHLAMTELKVIAAALLQRFRFEASPGRAAPKLVFNVSLRPGPPLHLSFTARS